MIRQETGSGERLGGDQHGHHAVRAQRLSLPLVHHLLRLRRHVPPFWIFCR